MNNLRRELAPISTEAWSTIDTTARETLVATLSGRKFVDIDGPHGIQHACVALGRLATPPKQDPGAVMYGVHQVLPLVESRTSFVLNTWELDNIGRGASDPDLDVLTNACRKSALFEENAIFEGFAPGNIAGLASLVHGKEIALSLETEKLIDTVSEAQTRMLKEGIPGPANLVVSAPIWKYLARSAPGGTLRSIIEQQIEGKVIYSESVKDALLVAGRGGDLALTIGQDLAIGYHSHTTTEINLFLTESFTFRVMNPQAVVGFKLK
ncbi:MAG TPA: family 1 encapsulin nanocompartment shell protein [bacterium]|nr:family 1 encapsulin nanocompartment shell protein [bacterium]